MANLLAADLLLDAGTAFAGGVLAISGIYDLIVANRKIADRRIFLKEASGAWLNVLLLFH